MASPSLALQAVVGLTVVLTPLVYTRASQDGFAVVELTVLVLGAVAAAAIGLGAALSSGRIRVPMTSTVVAAGVLLVALCAATVTADRPLIALTGAEGRSSGLMLYAACLVLFIGVLFLDTKRSGAQAILNAVLVSGAAMSAVVAAQWAGLDPLGAEAQLGTRIVGTLGNPNFASAYLGLTVPVALAAALRRDGPRSVRVAAGAAGALALSMAVLSDSVQGPIAAVAGVSVVLLALSRTAPQGFRRGAVIAWTGGAGVSAVLVGWGLRGVGPLTGVFSSSTFTFRKYYWSAAAKMGGDHPLLGIGLDRFGGYYREYRSDAATARLGSYSVVDAAHNVPLNMWASGGAIVVLAYVAFIVLVGWRLVRGLARIDDREHVLLLGAAGGAWVAYQVQALVSIDQPPLALAHFVTAGLVVLLSGDLSWRDLRFTPRAASNGGGALRIAVSVVSVLILLAVTYFAVSPLRSNLRLHAANQALARDDDDAALSAFSDARAQPLANASPSYQLGRVLARSGDVEGATSAMQAAVAKEPREPIYRFNLAQLLVATGRMDEAREQVAAALKADPRGVASMTNAGIVLVSLGDSEEALRVLERAVASSEVTANAFTALGDALRQLGRDGEARVAYQRSLALDPSNTAVSAAIEELSGSR